MTHKVTTHNTIHHIIIIIKFPSSHPQNQHLAKYYFTFRLSLCRFFIDFPLFSYDYCVPHIIDRNTRVIDHPRMSPKQNLLQIYSHLPPPLYSISPIVMSSVITIQMRDSPYRLLVRWFSTSSRERELGSSLTTITYHLVV